MPDRSANTMGVSPEQLATLSHEFRTPLNGVLGMARLLEGTRLTAEQRAYVAALKESGDHLLALVGDVLDLARLGAGKIELHPGRADIESLLRQVCELLSPRAHEKGIEIAWAIAPGVGPVIADEARVRQILLNFAGNAVKFTQEGGVLVSAEPAGEGRLRLTVSDSGPGVPQAARAVIFEAFAHADPAHGAALGGAGLGLAIARRLAQAMGGEIGVGGQVGVGADFWFEAPLPAAGPAPDQNALAGLSIAIASPSAVVREAAVRQVEACGGAAIAAADRAALLARAPKEAVLLLDHALHSGRGAFRPPAGRRAIVLLRPEERGRIERARANGFAGYLIKPLRRASLAARVLAALDGAQAPETPEAFEDERIAPAAAPGKRVLLAEDNPINAMLARALIEREGASVDRVASGEEALAALQAGAYDLVLMDVRMPGLNGTDATRALRARGVTIPIVALTADAFEDDRKACLDAGMDDVLVKPLTPDALRAALARWTAQIPGRPVWTDGSAQAKVAS